jgi:type IV secretion system protein VirD4
MSHKGIYLGFGPDGKMLSYPGDRHLFLIGPNGSGKGARILTQNIAMLTDRSLFIVDPKGEAAAMTIKHRRKCGRVIVLNPFGVLVKECPELGLDSTGFNPLANLDPDSDNFVDDAVGIADALTRSSGDDDHWIPSAQELLSGLCMHVKDEHGPDANLGHVRKLLTARTQYAKLDDGKKGAPIAGFKYTALQMSLSDNEAVAAKGSRFAEDSREELDSIISTAITQTRFLDSKPIARDLAKGGGFDFADMARETVTVYLILPARRLRTHSGWVRVIVQSALSALYETVPDRSRPSVLFMLDELPAAIGNLQIVEDAMGLARGYGVQLWPVVQDLSQLKDLYKTRWETFIANTGALLTFAPRDYSTAKYISDYAGTKSEAVRSLTSGRGDEPGSSTLSMQSVPLFRTDQLMGLNAKEGAQALLFTHLTEGPVRTTLPNYWDMAAMKPHLSPNPYYRNSTATA